MQQYRCTCLRSKLVSHLSILIELAGTVEVFECWRLAKFVLVQGASET